MPIIIDIDSVREACAIDINKNVVHEKIYKRIANSIAQIYSRIDNIKYSQDEVIKVRTHDIIGIFGRRGTGKTTVLLSVLDDIRKGNTSALSRYWTDSGKDVDATKLVPLPVVDPTMMGTKEHMLLRVVNLIRAHVERKVGCASPIQDAGWGQSFRKLVQGIVNLEVAGEGHQELFYDDFAASEKMNAIVHVEELEDNFVDFIHQSLQLLEKKAFVLAIDDMDTMPGAAWASLECIRKYFTTPQLIVLLAGDLEMFTEIIRAKQRKFFKFQPSKALGNFDFRPQMQLETLVEQYLLKLIPMMHRTEVQSFLWSLREQLGKYNIYDEIAIMDLEDEYTLLELLNYFNRNLGLHLPVLMDDFDKVLLDTPLRTTREIFACLAESCGQSWPDDVRTWSQRLSQMVQGLAHIFNNSLSQFGYADAPQELQALETPKGIVDLLDKLVLHRMLHANNDDLNPSQHPMWLATSLVVIQGALSHSLRNNPGVGFHYLLKISVFKELANRRGLLPANGEEYRTLRDNLHLADGIPLNDTGKYLAGLVPCGVDNLSYAHGLGTILLDVPEKYLHVPQWGSLYPLLGIYQREMPAGPMPAFSIWSFIGLMGDTLLASNDMLLEEVVRALPYPQIIPSQGMQREEASLLSQHSSLNPGIEPDTDSNEFSKRAEGVKTLLAIWRNNTSAWMKSEECATIAATLFPRIAQCYINYLQMLDKHKDSKEQNAANFAASYAKNCALLFLQAVLVEESRLVTNTSPLRSLSLAAPIELEDNFIANCSMIKDFFRGAAGNFSTIMPFFALCCTFPLWPLLLGENLVHAMHDVLNLKYIVNEVIMHNYRQNKYTMAAMSVLKCIRDFSYGKDENNKEERLLFKSLNIKASIFSLH